MLPGGVERDANVALRLGPATEIPRQFGPIRRAPWARTSASSRSWRSMPSLPISAKPAEMTTSAAHAARERLLGGLDHARRGHADDGEVDGVGDLVDRAVAANAGDRLAVAVDGVGGALEVALDDVPEELAADRPASPRRADHGDAARPRRTDAATR